MEDALKKEYLAKYSADGCEKFYKYLIFCALTKIVAIKSKKYKGTSPDLEFLDCYDVFIILYRREGNIDYMNIAKVFRKAAHKIYRIMLKEQLTPKNAKFLNLV